MVEISKNVTTVYKKVENFFVRGYKSTEKSIVTAFVKLCDKSIETFFAKEGETIADAKIRLSNKKR